MQETATKPASAAVELKDARLFREACYVDGQWVQAKSGAMISVDNPLPAKSSAACRNWAAPKRSRRSSRRRAFPAWSKKTAKERALFCVAGSI